jgi:hypothetical protein
MVLAAVLAGLRQEKVENLFSAGRDTPSLGFRSQSVDKFAHRFLLSCSMFSVTVLSAETL